MGALVGEGARNVLFRGNLFAANFDRNVRWKFNTTGAMVNNVIYGWGGNSSWETTNISDLEKTGKPILLDFISNLFIPGPFSFRDAYAIYSENTPAPGTRVYLEDNKAPLQTNVPAGNISLSSVVGLSAAAVSSGATLEYVLSNAGSRPWDRSDDDKRTILGVQSRDLQLKDTVKTWPFYRAVRRRIALGKTNVSKSEVNRISRFFEAGLQSF